MTNIYTSPTKQPTRARLVEIAHETLEELGYRVERVPGSGKSSLRRLIKDGVTLLAALKTTQDQWIAFVHQEDGSWDTLSEVDVVVAASVDDRHDPRFGRVHIIPAHEMVARFDRAWHAREAAHYAQPSGRGSWISLYHEERALPVSYVGAGAGLSNPEVGCRPLNVSNAQSKAPGNAGATPGASSTAVVRPTVPASAVNESDLPLTIAEAKRRLAKTLGIDPSSIRITIEG
jgi:hypothetical protein